MATQAERRQGDSSLVRKIHEIERASHDKSHFLAVASHDLRQPLHALGLYIAELRRKVSGEESQLLAGQIERSVEAMSALIDSLLDISKLDAGLVEANLQVFDLFELLNRIAADFKLAARIKNIHLVVRPIHGNVLSDPVLLERILVNLLSNALRYTKPFGRVLIGCRRRAQHVLIEVRDNGVGIAPAYQNLIFSEFFQLNQSVVGGEKGLGLGLAIVDRLVRLLGHSITLHSAPCVGSVFTLKLARVNQPALIFNQTGTYEPQPESWLAGKRVLIVDGDPTVREGTAMILKSWGYNVSAVSSIDAVQAGLLNGESWDLLISDYRLDHGATGIDVIDLVRQYLARVIPCILISGDTSQPVLQLAERAGLHLLHKPVKPARLRALIQHTLKELTH